ncbi:AraC family transcriptional regulator ligand-binding domain-containing protein [Pseudomonas aeruginosa]|nr:AraC family transcriptional regulator ligand-binding domain-containing protein [Pseudomonas aeruginosa]
MDRAERALPLEGLSLGEHYRLSDYGVAGLALQSAGTVGEALQLIKTNMLLFRKDIRGIAVRRSSCDTVDVDIDLQDKPDWPQSARLYHANVLASAAYAVFRDLLLGDLELVRLRLPERNGDVRAYEEYFRVPVYFAGEGITFTLPEELLEAEIATANSAVFQACWRSAARLSTPASPARWAATANASWHCWRCCRTATRASPGSPGN